MRKWKVIIYTIVFIWAFSFLLSNLLDKYRGDTSTNKIAVIPITGVITTTGDSLSLISSEGTSSTIIQELIKKANDDNSVKGVILEINSPGGSVIASKEIATAVRNSKKPIVAWIREVGTSGAYWIASESDKIVADSLSITGSIGVIGSYLEFSGLFEKYGINYERLVGGEYKDIGSPFRELKQAEKKLLQTKIDKIHENFIDSVVRNRKMNEKSKQEISTGIFFLGSEAKELGLVDELGGKEEAINQIKKLTKLEDVNLVGFQRKRSILDILSKVSASSAYYFGKGFGTGLFELNKYIDVSA